MNEREIEVLRSAIRAALDEDLGYGPDATTTATIAGEAMSAAEITPRQEGVLAGLPAITVVFEELDQGPVHVEANAHDGDPLTPGQPVAVVRGPTRTLLTAERTLLNLLTHLSGTATATALWVGAVARTGCAVRDTRKTLPGLRLLQKYAVRCGGGENHRLGLGDAVLIKDNHVAATGSISAALAAVREHAPHLDCEVEVDSLVQLDEAVDAGAGLVLLDNFTVADCAEAVRRVRTSGSRTRLEASGGIRLDQARAYAETGVDYLAVGALTHSVPALDIGFDLPGAPT